MKNKIIFFFLFLSCLTTNAQNESFQVRVDTAYFPYLEDIQMIQIEYTYVLNNKPFNKVISDYNLYYVPTPDENGLIDRPTTKYVFRDKWGEIISTFNNYDKQKINNNDLRLPNQAVVLDDSIIASFGQLFIFYQIDSIPVKMKNKFGSTVFKKYKLYTKPSIEYYGKQGLINRKGEIVLEPKYDDIFLKGKTPIIVKDGKIGFLDARGSPITPVKFQHLKYNAYGFIQDFDRHVVSVDSLIGIIDPYGKTLLDFDFKYISLDLFGHYNRMHAKNSDELEADSARFYFVTTKEGKNGFIDAETLEYAISPDKYDYIGASKFYENSCRNFTIRKDGRYGYINKFEEVIPLQYDTIIISNKRNYFIKDRALYGLYNPDFIMKLAVEYDTIIEKDDGYLVKKSGQYGFYDNQFELKIPLDYDTIIEIKRSFGRKIYITKKEHLYGVHNQYFDLKTPAEYDTIIHIIGDQYVNGYLVKKDELYGFLDLGCDLKLPTDFDTIIIKPDGYIVKKDEFYGFYDLAFDSKIPLLYQEIKTPIHNNHRLYNYKSFYFVRKGTLYAIFDEHFQQVTPFEFNEIENVHSFFKVKKGAFYAVLDSNFKSLCQPILIERFEPFVFYNGSWYQKTTTKDGKHGILGLENFFLKPIYDEIRFETDYYKEFLYFHIRKGKRWKKIKVRAGE